MLSNSRKQYAHLQGTRPSSFHFFISRDASSSATYPRAPLLFSNPASQSSLAGPKHLPWKRCDPLRPEGKLQTGLSWAVWGKDPCSNPYINLYLQKVTEYSFPPFPFLSVQALMKFLFSPGPSPDRRPSWQHQASPSWVLTSIIHAPNTYWAQVEARTVLETGAAINSEGPYSSGTKEVS